MLFCFDGMVRHLLHHFNSLCHLMVLSYYLLQPSGKSSVSFFVYQMPRFIWLLQLKVLTNKSVLCYISSLPKRLLSYNDTSFPHALLFILNFLISLLLVSDYLLCLFFTVSFIFLKEKNVNVLTNTSLELWENNWSKKPEIVLFTFLTLLPAYYYFTFL